MRFYEFAQAKREVLSTNRLDKDFKAHEGLITPKIFEFIEFKRVALPQQSFSKKDAGFTGHQLPPGYRHVHLMHGRLILIYRVEAQHLLLSCIITHKDLDGGPLSGFLAKLTPEDYHPFPFMPDEAADEGLSADQIAEVESVVYEYAASHRAVLDAFVQGNTDREFAEMLCMSADLPFSREGLDRVFAAFGGRDGLTQKVAAILKQTA